MFSPAPIHSTVKTGIRTRWQLGWSITMALFSISVSGPACAESATSGPSAPFDIQFEFEGRGLTWTVTNRTDKPCTRIFIPVSAAYDHVVPEGWEFERTVTALHAWTDHPTQAISPGQSAEFRITSGGNGGKPGFATARLTLADGQDVFVSQVATFESESLLTVANPPVVICLLAGLTFMWRRRWAKDDCGATGSRA